MSFLFLSSVAKLNKVKNFCDKYDSRNLAFLILVAKLNNLVKHLCDEYAWRM